jgi:pimeloyl-ACP methyl ester carboxylesterase
VTRHHDSEVTVYDRLVWPDGVLEHLLARGERGRELRAYLGVAEYAALAPLARAAAAVPPDPTRVVYLVPGIMGSQLGVPRAPPLPADLLWIDPVDFQRGGLLRLALGDAPGADPGVVACGPVIYSYLRLKLALAARGYTVRCFDYDWRHGVQDLGRELAARVAAEAVVTCDLVGHSMGGLVARAALATEPLRIGRVVTLGTPHEGAYAPLQALRGVYGTVRRLAQLDPAHTAEELATRVFAGFPSLYDMLPRGAAPDWLQAGSWPAQGPQPRAALLERSRALALPPAPAQVYCIVGTGQPTVTAARVHDAQLRYHITLDGDGTVPRASAALDGHTCRYATLAHSELPRDTAVATAVAELLQTGDTQRLYAAPPPVAAPVTTAEIDESALRAAFTTKLDWQRLGPGARHAWLDALNEPLRMPPPAASPP